MANIKISELPAASAALGTQEFEVNESGTSKKVTGTQIDDYVKSTLVAADITDVTATAAELNILDGVTATTAELNKLDGVAGAVVGTTDTQTLTNKTLTTPVINTSFSGTAIASQAEAEAGTATNKLMTPQRTAQAISALAGGAVDYQAFTASGTWTKPAGVTMVYVELWGGGGSGTSNRGSTSSGHGGAGGGFVATSFRASDLAATVSVTIGAGGAARVRTTNGLTAGAAGGTSSFGSLSALGGNGGVGAGLSVGAIGGNGEIGAIVYAGDAIPLLTIPASGSVSGSGGLSASYSNVVGGGGCAWGGGGGGARAGTLNGAGGVSRYGGNGGAAGSPTGVAGTAPAGGGGGAAASSGTVTSGAGARGEVRVWAW